MLVYLFISVFLLFILLFSWIDIEKACAFVSLHLTFWGPELTLDIQIYAPKTHAENVSVHKPVLEYLMTFWSCSGSKMSSWFITLYRDATLCILLCLVIFSTLRNSLSIARSVIYSVCFICVLCLGHLSVLSRSLLGGWVSGDVSAIRVVFMRGGWAKKAGEH